MYVKQDLQGLHPAFQADVQQVWDFETSVESRNAPGGTSKSSVLKQVQDMKAWLQTVTSA